MYEANIPLLLLAMIVFYLVLLRWPNRPWRVRLLMVLFWLLFTAANWWWTIRLPIDRNVGFAINIVSALLLLAVALLTVLKGGRDEEGSLGR